MKRSERVRPSPTVLVGRLGLLAAFLLVLPLALAPRADAFIYWTGGGIGRANLDGTAVNETFIDLPGGATSVAVGARHIYWMQTLSTTDGSGRVVRAPPAPPGAIGRAQLDGTHVDEDLITGFDADLALTLAVDEQHIYWTEFFLGQFAFYETAIARANLDGTGVERKFVLPGRFASGIAVDDNYIYWTGGDAIGRANLDGTEVENDFIPVPVPPNSPTAAQGAIEVDAEHVYWVNAASGPSPGSVQPTIARANLDGSAIDTSFIADWDVTFSPAPVDVAVDAEHIYWTNSTTIDAPGTIGRADLDGSNVDQRFIVPADGAYVSSVAVDSLADTQAEGKASAKRTQRQTGKKVLVKAKVKAKERLTAKASGKIKVNPTYRLKPKKARVATGDTKVLKLKTKKAKAKKIARALKRGHEATAQLKVRLTDLAGNRESERFKVRLRR
jgi:hypothetical protein